MNIDLTTDEAMMLLNLISQTSVPANVVNRMELMTRVDSVIRKLEAIVPEGDVLELPDAQKAAA